MNTGPREDELPQTHREREREERNLEVAVDDTLLVQVLQRQNDLGRVESDLQWDGGRQERKERHSHAKLGVVA
jgi:hypothetical protein